MASNNPRKYGWQSHLRAALSVFSTPLTKSPEGLGWQVEQGLNPSDVRPDYYPHWFWECFCCAAPWSVYEELNGFDETFDMGDDCHERNIRDRARLIGYDTWIDGRSVVQQIEHRNWQDDLLWHRRAEDSNIRRWNARLEKIKRGEYPFRSPNGFELVRETSLAQ